MAQADWTDVAGSLAVGVVSRGITSAITPPDGGGNQVFGFRSLALTAGAVALWANQASFGPMAAGGIVSGVLQRSSTGDGLTGFSPFLYLALQADAITENCYLLGLTDEDPHRIALVKAPLDDGIPAVAPGTLGVLRRSTEQFQVDKWLHLRLDVINQPGGDVLLQIFRNEVAIGSAPVWTAIPGLEDFTDDALGVATGSAPLIGGRAGFGYSNAANNRRAFIDQVEIRRQL